MKLVDVHAHLTDEALAPEMEAVLERAWAAGVGAVITVGNDEETSRAAAELARKRTAGRVAAGLGTGLGTGEPSAAALSAEQAGTPCLPAVYAAVGYHPHDAQSASEAGLRKISAMLARPEVVAVGEIGLDYYYELSLPVVQREVFRRQIRMARRAGKPIIVHSRDAHEDTLKILKEEKAEEVGGVMHCFSGDDQVARAVLDLGFYISFAGNLTFKSAHVLREVAAWLPLDRIMVETDCPYLAPEPRRGRRNEPAYVRYTANMLAQIRGLSLEELAQATSANACRLFRLPLAEFVRRD